MVVRTDMAHTTPIKLKMIIISEKASHQSTEMGKEIPRVIEEVEEM